MSIVVLLLLFGIGAMLKNPVRLLLYGERAQGTVVGMKGEESAPVQAVTVTFVTEAGNRISVTSSNSFSSPSMKIGEKVTVVYNRANPKNAAFLTWKEFAFGPMMLFGFTAFVVLLWICCILISKDPRLDDPFHLLPAAIAQFNLNPVRFPLFFILAILIPSCGAATYILSKQGLDIRSNGIRVSGQVSGYKHVRSRLNDRSASSGTFATVDYKDASGTSHTIRRALAKPLSRLKIGDQVAIIYPIRHPDKGVVNTWDEFYLGPLFFGFITVAFLALLFLVLKGMV